MKYIRTKDGIYENDENYIIFNKEYIYEKFIVGETPFLRHLGKVLNQADTIEELCDEFVVFDNNGKPQVYSPFNLKEWTTDNELFGAIWTSKGLIYVAKLNEKGELELL